MLNRGTARTNDWLELEFFRSRRHLQNHITKKATKASLTPVRATHHHSALDRFETNETRLEDGGALDGGDGGVEYEDVA